ncbi:MAG: Urea carboxylase-related aminomethyltransferase, partial [uncultured Solirubrobacteraceae bacterium]
EHDRTDREPVGSRRRDHRRRRAGRRRLDGRRACRPGAPDRRPARQPGRRHAALRRARSGRALQRPGHHPGAAGDLPDDGLAAADGLGEGARDDRRRHVRAPRHARRRLLPGEQRRPLRGAHPAHARLPPDVPQRGAGLRARAGEARPHAQHQLLHERAGDAGGRPAVRGRRIGAGQVRRAARPRRHAGADLELPAAQQPLQRLRPDARPAAGLGRGSRL